MLILPLFAAAALQSVTGRLPHAASWDLRVIQDPSADPVIWQSRPTNAEVAAQFPQGFSGQGYTHIRCRILGQGTSLEECITVDTGFRPPSPFAPYPEIDTLGLAVAKQMRLDPGFARRHALEPITIVFQFSAADNINVIRGFCLPFCSPHF